jgi:hypothetical protein
MTDCEVGYDVQSGAVTMAWRGYDAAAFRPSNERVLETLIDTNSDRLLGEIENLGAIPDHDLAWLARSWIPRATRSGLRRVALVTSAFQLDHAGVLIVGEQLPAGLELAYFDDRDAARNWLGGGST